jgi:hypothetical protein
VAATKLRTTSKRRPTPPAGAAQTSGTPRTAGTPQTSGTPRTAGTPQTSGTPRTAGTPQTAGSPRATDTAGADDTLDDLIRDWLTLPELAEAAGQPLPRIRQWLREGRLAAVSRGTPPTPMVPATLVHEGALLKGLPGTLTVLRDCGLDPGRALRWLFTPDPSLPGTPAETLRAGRHREVNRRAQLLAL